MTPKKEIIRSYIEDEYMNTQDKVDAILCVFNETVEETKKQHKGEIEFYAKGMKQLQKENQELKKDNLALARIIENQKEENK